jgi:FemAB-related protein (PEP-CTERM system-associated)
MSLRVHAYRADFAPAWDEYLRRSPGSHFASRSAWRGLVERWYGCRSDWRYAERDGQIVGVLPLFEKHAGGRVRSLFSAPGGLLADDAEAAAALLAPARERVEGERLELLELRDQRQRWEGLPTSEEHCTLVLDLELDQDAQWRAFDAKLRNQVRKAQKSGLSSRWGADLLPDWHRVMLHNMRDLGTPFQDAEYFRAVLQAYAPGAELEVVEFAGQPIGALALIGHADGRVNPWASALRAHRSRCPSHLLYWEAIRRAIAGGARWFDFGRSQWGSGTFDFKRSWSARPVPLYYQYVLGTARRVPSLADQKHSFALAVRLWQSLPVALAGAIGPAARRRFPEVL